MLKIGILAVQGDFAEHKLMLTNLDIDAVEIRLPEQLEDIDGLIIPGGESTTIAQLLDIFDIKNSIITKAKSGMPIGGTCAGMIMLANSLTDKRPTPLKLMNTVVSRNAFGRQIDSFEETIEIKAIGHPKYRGIFIRAPMFIQIGEGVEVLGKLNDDNPVLVREKNLLASSFHPELTPDTRIHEYFIKMVKNQISNDNN
ncbi:MAG: pyridoxal 5'-phosphate synthase subunit PdxT [Chloroflexota bacterium]|nr:MAG: pyridoxal 5'-phosphate synthase subunit PdxT [Chloroflexota bacterium]